mmetsp:Transcript_33703/g.60993  ORF Transcript_33703/g.60993 Transcript_33703/m.60993 type:complete len:353 (+) Transcript_33703:88-1146(+)
MSGDALQSQAAALSRRLEAQKLQHSEELARFAEEAQALKARLSKALARRSQRDGSKEGMAEVDTAYVRRVDWKISEISAKVRTTPRNTGIWSGKLTVMGVSDLVLEFFPQGRDTTTFPGFCAAFLWGPPGLWLKYRLHVGEHSVLNEDFFDSRMGHGHSNFCNLQAQVDKSTDSVVVGLDILEICHYHEPAPGLRLVNRGPEDCVKREAEVLRNRELESVDWTIKDVRRRVQEVPAGQCIASPMFSIAGVREMQLLFYPNGTSPSLGVAPKAGYCGFYLRCAGGQFELALTLFVGSAKKGPNKTEFSVPTKGMPEFCRLEDQLQEGEEDIVCGVIVHNPDLDTEELERTLHI